MVSLMPYITKDRRWALVSDRGSFCEYSFPQNAGELNFVITTLLNVYLVDKGTPRYADYNEVIGALECAKLELYRRMVAPYEDSKKVLNGDVYP